MNKIKILLGLVVIPAICVVALTAVASAQDTPAPYAGMKNPFKWNDAAAIRAGKAVYLKSCFSCHGATGADVPKADFSLPEMAAKLEARPDFAFYISSEGIKDTEMAGYKHTVTEQQRWQVLTYMYTLGAAATPPPPPPVGPGTPAQNTTPTQNGTPTPPDGQVVGPVVPDEPPPPPPPPPVLTLHVAEKAIAGEPLHISVKLTQGNETIPEAPVSFFFKLQYYTNNAVLTPIGQAITGENGTAEISLTPKTTGYVPVIARYTPEGEKPIEVTSTVVLTADYPLYEKEVGLEYKGFPPDIVLFPKDAWTREPGIAPVTAFRIPGGLPFIPFAAYLGVVILVWSLFVFVMYQIYRIAPAGDKLHAKGINLRLLPMAGMVVLALVGLLMVSILVKGPYSGHVILP